MVESTKDTGIITALLERFTKQRLPRFLALKEKVDRGELLSEFDIGFLKEVSEDIQQVEPLIDKHPELQPLAGRALHLYQEITAKALENEKKS